MSGTCCGCRQAIWWRAGGFAPSTVSAASCQQHSFEGWVILLVTSVLILCASGRGILCLQPASPSGRIVTGALLLVTALKDVMNHPRHGSYPQSHIATRSPPDAMPSISFRDTLKRCSHVVVVLPARPTAPLGLCIPGMTDSLPSEHQLLHARRATSPCNGQGNKMQV